MSATVVSSRRGGRCIAFSSCQKVRCTCRTQKMTTPPTAKGMQLPFGTLHPELQQYDAFQFEDSSTASSSSAKAHDVRVDPTDIATWVQQWPSSSRAFYTPRLMVSGDQSICPHLTYGDLNDQMKQCPPWRRTTDQQLNVLQTT